MDANQPSRPRPGRPSMQRSASAGSLDVKSIKNQIRELEGQPSRANLIAAPFDEALRTRRDLPVDNTSGTSWTAQSLDSIMAQSHKSRRFGRSHWINIVAEFREMLEMAAPHLRDKNSAAVSGMRKCEALAEAIKHLRLPSWPTPLTNGLPSKELADDWVDNYLATTETLYRVVHWSIFRRDYERFLSSDTLTDKGFLVQIKLIWAIGAVSHSEQSAGEQSAGEQSAGEQSARRDLAISWVYEAQAYLSDPSCKSRLGFQFLQNSILLLIAQEATGIGGDSTWISAGTLLRTAMHMGLHKDPANTTPAVPKFLAEMHRRLWNTVLELALQSSMASGKPPLISLDDFDTRPPSNFDDEQLTNGVEHLVPRPDHKSTLISIPIALRKTFPIRLAIVKLLNDGTSRGTYEETLKLESELIRVSREAFAAISPPYESGGTWYIRFDIDALTVIIDRYIVALHVPFLGRALQNTDYAHSTSIAVSYAHRIWNVAGNNGFNSDFGRFTVCGSGFFRTAVFQASLIIGLDFGAWLRKELRPGNPVLLHPGHIALPERAKAFSLSCIEAGETNIKGYLFNCMVAAQVEGLIRGLGQDKLRDHILKAAKDAVETCLPLLEKMVTRHQPGCASSRDAVSLNTPSDALEDLDFLFSDVLSNSGNDGMVELASWMAN
ncbi:hypothetical protein QBC46DRAFT_356080 [Diplogelasinospora grovesii]|uniref:Xylanolytic transcriptional activator regulatory domain-containing protein n=1 Tax=Diplogelasinospora grovesii TaxID=303347 RepID=A0AAN6S1X8_9PEZI|nr:hypothetical protein QBC46DRAFT_356080 [Diplogelasinospora grovesii]